MTCESIINELNAAKPYVYIEDIFVKGDEGNAAPVHMTATALVPRARGVDWYTIGLPNAPACQHGRRSLKRWRAQSGKECMAWVCSEEPTARASLSCEPIFVWLSQLLDGTTEDHPNGGQS